MSGTYVVWPPGVSGGGSGGGVTVVGSMDAQAASVNGASISLPNIYMQSATGSNSGLVNIVDQSFAGIKTFVSSPIIAPLAAVSPVFTSSTGQLTSGSVSLTTQVVGNLPITQTSGSVSLVNKVVGNLPLSQTSGSISLINQVSGALPLANTSGSISLVNQVSGNLPLSQTSGSISLTTQVSGVLPLANTSIIPIQPGGQTSGSLSLTQQISGILPQTNLTLTPTFSQATLGSVTITSSTGGASYTLRLPGSLGSPNQFLSVSSAGFLSWASSSGGTTTTGSVTQTSSAGGNTYTVSWPGAQGTSGLSLINDGSGNLSWGFPAGGVINATTTYSIGSTETLILCSSASFNITMPTAVGQKDRRITLQSSGISISQAYTVLTVSGQTVGGVASAKYILNTNNESATFCSDNSNWQQISHFANTAWASAGSTTITATTSSPTKGALAADNFFWRRIGDSMECRIEYRQTGAGSAGTGDYLFRIPASASINTASLTAYLTVGGTPSTFPNCVGQGTWSAGTPGDLSVVVYDQTNVRFFSLSDNAFVSNATRGLDNSTQGYKMFFSVPIAGWQP